MKTVIALSVPFALMGCATDNSIYRTFDVTKFESPMVDIRQRAVLVSPHREVSRTTDMNGKEITKTVTDKGVYVCAEPSPDAMASLAYEIAAKANIQDKVSGELGFTMNDSAAFTGLRTQSIQLLRDFGYRLCESHMSGAITNAQYDLLMRRFQKNTVALLAIEQLTGTVRSAPIVLTSNGTAEATKALSEQRSEREKIGDQIGTLEQQRNQLKKQRDDAKTADPKADTTETDAKIASIEGKIGRLIGDRDIIDQSITNSRGVLASGKTEVTIKTEGQPTQRSDEHLQKVADVVREIVSNIVLSDDENQVCMSTLQSPQETANQKAFATWCLSMLNNQSEARRLSIIELQKDIEVARKKVADAKPADKKNAEKALEEKKKRLDDYGHGSRTFSTPIHIDK